MNEEQRAIYCVFFVYIFSPARYKPDIWQSIPPPFLFLSPGEISLFYPLTSHSTPFTKDYLSYKFGIMDHVVLKRQMIGSCCARKTDDSTLRVWNSWYVETITVADIFQKSVKHGLYSRPPRVSRCMYKCVQFVWGSRDHAGNEDVGEWDCYTWVWLRGSLERWT